MSTRAVYTFKDRYETIHVYKHHDGYPAGGISWIANALPYAWELPRFEASDFSAAFVAANKDAVGGGVRLTMEKEASDVAGDAEYHYIVSCVDNTLDVQVYEVNWWSNDPKERTQKLIFKGPLSKAIRIFNAKWIKENVHA